MTQRKALGDLDVDSAFDDPDNGWFGHARAVGPTSPRVPDDDSEDTDRWPVLTVDPTPTPAPAPRNARVIAPSTMSRESRPSGSGAWDFKASTASGPRFQPKLLVAIMIAAIVAVAGIVLLLRGSGPVDEQSTVVAPSESTSQPAPTTTAPALGPSSQPAMPPPPPTAQEVNPPVVTRDYTPRRRSAPDESAKPEIGVTRAPTTRTQMSATPPPPRTPDRNSSTPGDGPKRNGFGF